MTNQDQESVVLQDPINKHATEALETLDAALFTGDDFNSRVALDLLDDHLDRWKRRSQEIREWLNQV